VNTSKKNCRQTNDGRYFKITVNDNSIAVIENLFFISLQNSIIYNNNNYVSVPVLNFDNALNLKWSKNILIRQDSLNPVFMISDDIVEVKDNFIFSLRSNLNKVFLYYTDTAGNTGNCYNTVANYAVRTLTTIFTDTSFNTSPSLFTVQQSTLPTASGTESTVITLECVPPLKPVSNFVTNYTNGASDTSTVCLNAAVSFTDSSKNDPSIFNWVFPPEADVSNADSSCFPNIGNVFFLTEGVFAVKLIACNNFGCDTITKFIQISTLAIPPSLGNDTTICPGDSIAIVYTDTLNSTHQFTGSNGLTTSQDTIFIKESGTYQCTVTSDCGIFSDEITVTVLQKPAAAFTHEIFCDSLKVSFTGNAQTNGNAVPVYNWSFFSPANVLIGNSAVQNPIFAFPSFDSFKVTLSVSSSYGCTAVDNITKFIYLKAKPIAAFTATNVCGSLTASFNNNSTVAADSLQSYYWDFGNGQTSNEKNPPFTFSSYGSKIVKLAVTSSRGCTAEKTITFELSNAAVSAGADTVILQNTPYTLQGSGAVNYEWKPATLLNNATSANPVAVLKNDQLFTLEATDANGCTWYDSVLIKVISNIFIPNAFSPSGINKLWRIKQLSNYKSVRLSVYNRYGQKVFEGSAANDYTWDGTFKNKLQAAGAYVYLLQTDDGKRVRNFTGTVMLVR
jgi:gliding motility-associated-like protein